VTASPLRARVVYESMFGNTATVAAAVVSGLELEGVVVESGDVVAEPSTLADDLDLLVLGAPTHGFSLSRARTRHDAVRQGAPPGKAVMGVREWLDAVRLPAVGAPLVAAFDTRAAKVRWLPQAAAPAALRLARQRGLETVGKPIGFLVDDIRGPLEAREPERAVAWGRQLAVAVQDRLAAGRVGRGR
jgi:hypothetical protein